MIKLYSIIEQSQQKSPIYKLFSKISSPKPVNLSLDSLNKRSKQVFDYLVSYCLKYKVVRIKNQTIADYFCISVRSVQRATKALHDAGIITKRQSNVYDVNRYTLNRDLMMKYINKRLEDSTVSKQALREDSQDFVIHNSGSGKDSYNYPNLLSKKTSYARTRENWYDGLVTKKVKKEYDPERYRRLNEGISLLKAERQAWLQSGNSMGNFKPSQAVMKKFSTDAIENIASKLRLNEKELLKLIVYPTEAIRLTSLKIDSIFRYPNQLKRPIKDRMGWLIDMLNRNCTLKSMSHNDEYVIIVPLWGSYYQICELMGISSTMTSETPLPIVFPQRKPQADNAPVKEQVSSVAAQKEGENVINSNIQIVNFESKKINKEVNKNGPAKLTRAIEDEINRYEKEEYSCMIKLQGTHWSQVDRNYFTNTLEHTRLKLKELYSKYGRPTGKAGYYVEN